MADGCPKCEAGLPPWMGTFADLMSLLMCFFVLLLSFATIDAVRFKKMAESMKDAFGVQREIPASEIVMGVSVIKQEWSPTVAEQAVITEIRQETSDEQKEHLKMKEAEGQGEQAQSPPPVEPPTEMQQEQLEKQAAMEAAKAEIEKDLAEQLHDLQEALELEVEQGLVTLEKEDQKIIVRVQEKGSFGSGSARLDPAFHEVMDRISAVLAKKPGQITVAGHSDNIPISTGRFRSNWELSSARAVTVLHSLLRNKDIAEDRVVVQGFADTQPLVDNSTPQNRAKNRRVELILRRGIDQDLGNLDALQGAPDQ
ncbi:MAG: OmpA family protein [Gammaproteobacteria bacterium]|nr:OmpA family protein [Gammaproteobacteria bacterium]MCB1923226.1 OmpA family protein [Gammaproteobacteria bacterium]